jgi:two-component system, cell cycle sensor histidine kinase and response regulator CckA
LDEFPDPVAVVDRGGVIVYASPAIAALLGRVPEELVGQEFSSLLAPRFRADLARTLAELSTDVARIGVEPASTAHLEGAPRVWELAIRRAASEDGPLFFVCVRASNPMQPGGDLRPDQETYRRIVEGTRDGIWLLDAEGRTTFVNPQMAAMLGQTVDGMLGRSPREFMDEDVWPEANRMIERHRQGLSDVHPLRFRHQSGRSVWTFVSSNPLQDEHGDYIGALGVVTDMGQRQRLEEQLLHAQKMEAVSRLAGGIAHEFNNLLTTIVGAAELLSFRLGGQPEVRSELSSIRTATDRAATLVRRLLTFARRQNANPRVVDLCAAVRSADRILASALGEEVELSIVTADLECSARVDVAQIEQALLNLVINARDAMPEGGEVTVSVERTSLLVPLADLLPGEYVKLVVTDTGTGMTPEILERIFEPFFTTKPREYGSGLGLAIVYGIVQQSGGYITADSTPGQGTTFSVYLPYVVPQSEPDTAADETAEESAVPRGGETILVVEDDELVRGITVRSLRTLGYRILLAEDGEDALRVVERHAGDIDLVVTDVAMPRMGGPELADKLTLRYPRLKVLFVSGYSEQELSERMVLARNRAFLDKPFTASMLARKLREMLDRSGEEGAADHAPSPEPSPRGR